MSKMIKMQDEECITLIPVDKITNVYFWPKGETGEGAANPTPNLNICVEGSVIRLAGDRCKDIYDAILKDVEVIEIPNDEPVSS